MPSRHPGGRIDDRRIVLPGEGRILATLPVEAPRGLHPCLEEAVTMMSLSFRRSSG